MASLNKIMLIGRLVADPNLRFTTNGTATAKFTLAVNRNFKSDKGEETDFINIVLWRDLAENCSKYLQKGSLAMVEGRLSIRSYEKDGERKWMTEVVGNNVQFLDKVKSSANTGNDDVPPPVEDDTELPF
jgi:single-strand DNA-binding protein